MTINHRDYSFRSKWAAIEAPDTSIATYEKVSPSHVSGFYCVYESESEQTRAFQPEKNWMWPNVKERSSHCARKWNHFHWIDVECVICSLGRNRKVKRNILNARLQYIFSTFFLYIICRNFSSCCRIFPSEYLLHLYFCSSLFFCLCLLHSTEVRLID